MSEENFRTATFEEKLEMFYGKMTEKQWKDSIEQVIYMCKDYCGKCPTQEATANSKKTECYYCNRCVDICPVNAIKFSMDL